MTAYATLDELASYLQQTVDNSTGNLVLASASALFDRMADTRFTPTTVTYSIRGNGGYELMLPYRPVISIQAVRIAGVTVTDFTLIKRTLYRVIGFGSPWAYPPNLVEVDLTYGYASVPADVKGAVLETAADAYISPDAVITSEKIDDYEVKSAPMAGGMQLSPSAMSLALFYRGSLVA